MDASYIFAHLDEFDEHVDVGDHEPGDLGPEADHGPESAVLRHHPPLLAHLRSLLINYQVFDVISN